MEILKKIYNCFIIISIIEILVGILFFLKPALVQGTISYIVGSLLIVFGLIVLITFFVDSPLYSTAFKAVILICAGLFILIKPGFIFSVMAVIFGLYLVVDGIAGIRGASMMKSREDSSLWVLSLVIAILTIVLGLIVLAYPLASSLISMKIFGILLIISGVLNIYNGGITKRYFKKALKLARENGTVEYVDVESEAVATEATADDK